MPLDIFFSHLQTGEGSYIQTSQVIWTEQLICLHAIIYYSQWDCCHESEFASLFSSSFWQGVSTVSQESPISQITNLSPILLTSLYFLKYLKVEGLSFIR